METFRTFLNAKMYARKPRSLKPFWIFYQQKTTSSGLFKALCKNKDKRQVSMFVFAGCTVNFMKKKKTDQFLNRKLG